MNCPKCSAPVDANSRFCGRCGQRIDPAGATPQPSAQPAAAGAVPAAGMGGNPTQDRGASTRLESESAASAVARLIERIKNIIVRPKLEWPVIAPEATSVAQHYTGYVMPLAGFAAVMSFLHLSVDAQQTAGRVVLRVG